MTVHTLHAASHSQKRASAPAALLTPQETAQFLKVSNSWLAKARMRGEGPPYVRLGRAIRYLPEAVLQWIQEQVTATHHPARSNNAQNAD
jgi:predicted DNA-binding transcriptional regulator AlpA